MTAGFQLVRSRSGSGGTGGTLETYDVPASVTGQIAPGDVVQLNGSSTPAGSDGVPGRAQVTTIAVAEAGQVVGVVSDFEYNPLELTESAPAGATFRTCMVDVEPLNLYEVDSDATLLAADVGANAGINGVVPSVSGGLTSSAQTLDSSSIATDATLPLNIVALLEDDAGILGNRALVRFNNTTTSAGVLGA